MLDYGELMATFDNMIKETESQMDEYIEHEEYTLEEQRFDEGYISALEWAMRVIADFEYPDKYETDPDYRAMVDMLEEEQEQNGFYKFQDEMEMWRNER